MVVCLSYGDDDIGNFKVIGSNEGCNGMSENGMEILACLILDHIEYILSHNNLWFIMLEFVTYCSILEGLRIVDCLMSTVYPLNYFEPTINRSIACFSLLVHY